MVVYQERAPKIWAAVCVGAYVIGMGWLAVGSLPDDLVPWLAVCGLFLLLLLPCLVVPFSKFIYHRIRLTPQTLRVGRERLPVASLDPDSVQGAYQASLAGSQPFAAQPAAAGAPRPPAGAAAPLRSGEPPRLVGGAWGVPMGMAAVRLRTRQGEELIIASRRPRAFLAALCQLVEGGWGPPAPR